jgi:hypothetical protein
LLKVTKITVRSFDLDRIDVFWEIDAVKAGQSPDLTQHEIYDYQFYVMRSEQPLGPYDIIGGPFRDPTYFFRDNKVSLLSLWRSFYYKIRVVHAPSGDTQDYGPASNDEPEPDRITRAIRFEEDVLIREFVGRKCWVFPVRTFGPRCNCWDPISSRKTRTNHAPCFGTGWLGGYMTPVECYVQIDPNPRNGSISSLGENQASPARGRLTSFPPLNPRDILVESENRRWRVDSVTPTERLRAVLHQELTLVEIPRGEIEYSLPVNVDLRTLQPASERNFSNSQNVGTGDGTYDDIITFYGTPRGSL